MYWRLETVIVKVDGLSASDLLSHSWDEVSAPRLKPWRGNRVAGDGRIKKLFKLAQSAAATYSSGW